METINTLKDAEECVSHYVGHKIAQYLALYVDDGQTKEDNEVAYHRWYLRPKIMKAADTDVATTVLGQPVSLPIGIAPSAFHSMLTYKGEVATAAAANILQTIYVQSAAFTQPDEDIAAVSDGKLHWMLLSVRSSREYIKERIQIAERLKYGGLVLGVDSPISGHRRAYVKHPFVLPPHIKTYGTPGTSLEKIFQGPHPGPSAKTQNQVQVPLTLVWEDLLWFHSLTSLPIIVKGILTGEDAHLAVKYGAAAVWVSNHGGRKLDTVPATLDVLPEIVNAVNGQAEVYIDSGVRTGEDVLKALALGANFVFLGRPVAWGLGINGEQGVVKIFDILKKELKTAMRETGCTSIHQVTRDLVLKKPYAVGSRM